MTPDAPRLPWLAERLPHGGDRSRHLAGRLLDVAGALVVATNDDEAAVLTAAVEWGGHVTAREVADVAAGVLAAAVEELARTADEPAAAVIQRLRAATDRRPALLPDREERT